MIGAGPLALPECHATWSWNSYACDPSIVVGAQLGVGIVLARQLPLVNTNPQSFDTWDTVEVWAKYRVNLTTRFNSIFMGINDISNAGPTSGNILGVTANNVWRVAYATATASTGGFPGWDDPATNLRATLSFFGTTTAANVGLTIVDIEWFAVRLTPPSL